MPPSPSAFPPPGCGNSLKKPDRSTILPGLGSPGARLYRSPGQSPSPQSFKIQKASRAMTAHRMLSPTGCSHRFALRERSENGFSTWDW